VPPATTTLPDASVLAVWRSRAVAIAPPDVQLLLSGYAVEGLCWRTVAPSKARG
jgi:hypothetical protein